MEKEKEYIRIGTTGWSVDKDIENFMYLVKNLRSERKNSRADCVEYLIERVKIAENKLKISEEKQKDIYYANLEMEAKRNV